VLAAVSVDHPEETRELRTRLEDDDEPLRMELLCDPTRAATKALGIFDAEHDIALPAILIMGPQGDVRWKYVGDSITDRPDEEEVVAALKRVRGSD
jgi:peroxiredoxin